MRGKQSQLGFTIIELLIAISFLAVIMSALFVSMLSNARANTTMAMQLDATRLVEQKLEIYRQSSANYKNIYNNSTPIVETMTIGGKAYVITSTVCDPSRPQALKIRTPCSADAIYVDVVASTLDSKNSTKKKILSEASSYFTKFGAPNADQ